MMSRLEKLGLLSILEKQAQEAQDYSDKAEVNSKMRDQSENYRAIQRGDYRFYSGQLFGLQKAIQEIQLITTSK